MIEQRLSGGLDREVGIEPFAFTGSPLKRGRRYRTISATPARNGASAQRMGIRRRNAAT